MKNVLSNLILAAAVSMAPFSVEADSLPVSESVVIDGVQYVRDSDGNFIRPDSVKTEPQKRKPARNRKFGTPHPSAWTPENLPDETVAIRKNEVVQNPETKDIYTAQQKLSPEVLLGTFYGIDMVLISKQIFRKINAQVLNYENLSGGGTRLNVLCFTDLPLPSQKSDGVSVKRKKLETEFSVDIGVSPIDVEICDGVILHFSRR